MYNIILVHCLALNTVVCLRMCFDATVHHCQYRSTLNQYTLTTSDLRGLEVACWPLVPKFTGSNPAEAVGFLRAKKSSAHLPSEGK